MELIYLENITHKNLKNLNICFSNEYQFKDIHKKNEIIPANVFNKNLKLNVIVGENGSGKSALLEHIYNFSNMNYSYGEEESESTHGGSDFLIYKNDELFLKGDKYGTFNGQLELKTNNDSLNCSLINFNNEIKNDNLYYNENNIFKILKVLSKKYDILKHFNQKFIFKKIKFSFNRDDITHFNENLNNDINLFKFFKERIITLINENVAEIPCSSTYPKLNKKTMYTTNNIELELKIIYLIKYLKEIQEKFIQQSSNYKEYLKKNENTFNDITFDNMFDKILEFDKNIAKSTSFKSDSAKNISAIKELISILKNEYSINSNNFTMNSKFFIDEKSSIDYEASFILDIEENKANIISIVEQLEKNLQFTSFFDSINFDLLSYSDNISFNNLSSGEQSLINRYMYIVHEIIYNYSEIILLDEPDTLLHPNWAKSFISNLVNILEKDSLLKDKKVHIIITTHSPFLLSDIPKENIIFLKDGKQEYPFKENEQTFGANIHTLLSHGFFMEDGLMGEFAKNKISEVIEILKKPQLSEDEIKDCKHIISIIGEPILQKTLEHQLNEKLNPNETELQKLEREQKEIKEKIANLKRENYEAN